MKLIGLSLSYCIGDVVRGRAKEDDIDRIIAGTCCHNDAEFSDVVDFYTEHYWDNYPLARELAWKLWNEKRIDQPRLRGEEPVNIARGYWVRDVSDI